MNFNQSPSNARYSRIPTWAVVLIGFPLLFLRAWPRLLNPNVWDEDGMENLPGFIKSGVFDLLKPVHGYLILIPKLITMASASVSLVEYPRISTYLAWGFTLLVFAILAKAPTRLRGGIFLAVACMLVPSNPECFGLPLYTFWWSALLLFLLIFWDETHPCFWFRGWVVFLASLSSPVSLMTLPLFWWRALKFKKYPTEMKIALLATFCAGVQLWAMWPIDKASFVDLNHVKHTVTVFLGGYTVGNIFHDHERLLGNIVLAYLAIAVYLNKNSWEVWGLIYLWWASVLMSMARVDIYIIAPSKDGPRYFFFPFILLSWLLLQVASAGKNAWIRGLAVIFLILGVVNACPVLGRSQDDLNWAGHVYSCAQFDEYTLPVHFDGIASSACFLPMKGSACTALLRKDPFARPQGAKTYPYRMIRYHGLRPADIHTPGASEVRQNEWSGLGNGPAGVAELPPGYKVIGTSFRPGQKAGSLTIHFHRGQEILFRTPPQSASCRIDIVGRENEFYDAGPKTDDWFVLDFSNRLLDKEFDVRFVDVGAQAGDWSAVALK